MTCNTNLLYDTMFIIIVKPLLTSVLFVSGNSEVMLQNASPADENTW